MPLTAFTKQIRRMFDNLAPKYDLLNKVNSFGLDIHWRKALVEVVSREDPGLILDLAAGTGDVTIALATSIPDATIVAADLSPKMLYRTLYKALDRGFSDRVKISEADALNLPFPDDHFDALTCAFGVRNFEDIPLGLSEMHRVLAPGGMVAILELCEPVTAPVNGLYQFHSAKVMPFVSGLLGAPKESYRYLHDSIAEVPSREVLERLMREAGFRQTYHKIFLPGVAGLYVGYKPRFTEEITEIKRKFGKILARETV